MKRASSPPVPDRDALLLSSARLAVGCSRTGSIRWIENREASERYDVARDCFELETDLGSFSNRGAVPARVRRSRHRVRFSYEFAVPGGAPLRVELIYELKAGARFLRRRLVLSIAAPLRLTQLCLGDTLFAAPAEEAVHYLTFWMAPTAEFIRWRAGGLFTGIENPFYRAELDERRVRLSFPPGLILAAGERYESEPQFIGVYRRSGTMIEDSGRPFRYPNGSAHIPIDRSESRAMREFALDYLAPTQKRPLTINYQFFHPLPQLPENDAQVLYFTKAIDTFADIGGDLIIFNPLHPYSKPDARRGFWDLLPDDPNAPSRRVVDYARRRGIAFGFYMGCAAHGEEGNSGGLPFRPDKPEWKKLDAHGVRAPDNCIACDAFYAWWVAVQDATIKRFHLGSWCWDPSLGSGMNCCDESHGHVAGMGAYKGWRRSVELMRTLKTRNRGLFIQLFYGMKQFGLWGLKHVDGHEVYNEQTACVSTHHTQISDDRQNADGVRFQNWWSMRFRFLPAVIGHPLVGRMNEGPWDPELAKAFDQYGWRYALMSALAISGSVMPSILPYESSIVHGYAAFYRRWLAWAKRHFDLVAYTEPFGEQVQPGAVDGYARIKRDRGFLFLFNGNPRPSRIEFELGDEINLYAAGRYELVERFPSNDAVIVVDAAGRSAFALGERVRIVVPANTCLLLELRRTAAPRRPVLAGVSGRVTCRRGRLDITSVSGRPGGVHPVRLRLPRPRSVRLVRVNGVTRPFSVAGDEIALDVAFAGARFVRELDDWTTPGGSPFRFPRHERRDQVELSITFWLNEEVERLLAAALPANAPEMDATIARWQQSREISYSYHNFVCCRPNRLWLVIPFTRDGANVAQLWVNSRDRSDEVRVDRYGHCCFADLTELVTYGGENSIRLVLQNLQADSFMGPFLLYPDEDVVTEILAAAPPAPTPPPSSPPPARVVYSESLVPAPPPRYRKGARRPLVTRAELSGSVTLTHPATLRVSVDLPRERMREVLYSESGFPWMSMAAMSYDPDERCWRAEIRPGRREAIQESEHLWVWAIDADGLYSDFYPVRIGWSFSP